MITDRQVRLMRQKRMEGKTQEAAAAKAGMSVRSARKWQTQVAERPIAIAGEIGALMAHPFRPLRRGVGG